MTRWSEELNPDNLLSEYPRPQAVRNKWLNLNGRWDYAVRDAQENGFPDRYDGKILVPFPIEAALSGVQKPLLPNQKLWYHRIFTVPEEWAD